jgi:hypothetical protein
MNGRLKAGMGGGKDVRNSSTPLARNGFPRAVDTLGASAP